MIFGLASAGNLLVARRQLATARAGERGKSRLQRLHPRLRGALASWGCAGRPRVSALAIAPLLVSCHSPPHRRQQPCYNRARRTYLRRFHERKTYTAKPGESSRRWTRGAGADGAVLRPYRRRASRQGQAVTRTRRNGRLLDRRERREDRGHARADDRSLRHSGYRADKQRTRASSSIGVPGAARRGEGRLPRTRRGTSAREADDPRGPEHPHAARIRSAVGQEWRRPSVRGTASARRR